MGESIFQENRVNSVLFMSLRMKNISDIIRKGMLCRLMLAYAKDRKELNMDINQKITEELGVKKWQVDAAVKLIDEGNTIPFIARYRKEATGTLDDEQLRKLYERLVYLRNLEEKKQQVLSSIEEQGKLTADLKKQILGGGGI